jgi:hypothetical protein
MYKNFAHNGQTNCCLQFLMKCCPNLGGKKLPKNFSLETVFHQIESQCFGQFAIVYAW